MDSLHHPKPIHIRDSPVLGPVLSLKKNDQNSPSLKKLKSFAPSVSIVTVASVETPAPRVTKYRHEHFGFRSHDDVTHFAMALIEMGFRVSSEVFLDEFWDTPNLKLMQSNIWLRTRDGKFEASRTDKPLDIPLPIEQVKELKDIVSLLVHIGVLTNFSAPTAEQPKALRSSISNCCSRRIALLPTLRTSYESPDSDCVVRIDTFKSNGTFWTIGSVSTTKDNNELLSSEKLKAYVSLFSYGKLFTALKDDIDKAPNSPNTQDIRQLLATSLVCEAKGQASSFTGILNEDYPFDQFDNACKLALLARIPLELGFRSALELEHLM